MGRRVVVLIGVRSRPERYESSIAGGRLTAPPPAMMDRPQPTRATRPPAGRRGATASDVTSTPLLIGGVTYDHLSRQAASLRSGRLSV